MQIKNVFFTMLLAILLSSSSALGQFAGAIAPKDSWSKGFKTITEKQSKDWVKLLAGEKFKGRGTGQAGYLKAAFFMAGKLAEYGFEPIGDNGTYFQNLPFSRILPEPERTSLSIGDVSVDGGELGFTSYSGSTKVEGEVVFIKAVGASARLGDPANYRGKILFVVRENATALRRDLLTVRPKAVINVVSDDTEIESSPITNTGRGFENRPVELSINVSTAKKLAAAVEVDAKMLSIGKMDRGIMVAGADKNATIDLKVIDQPITNPNVVGWLEGSDPKLKHEHIIIGAHLDHLGLIPQGLFPGADDNASGSTAILQVAKALTSNGKRPKRSVLMIWFAAEEKGLIGSKHYAKNPIKPIKDCVCMLNIDMIGRNEEKPDEPASENEDTIHLIGTKKLTDKMHEIMIEANRYVGYKFEYDEEDTVFRRSDQASFHDVGLPVAFVFGGFNPYYHQTTDTIQGINPKKVANCARLYYVATYLAADAGHLVKRQ